ncbi:MAG: hypothetical protein H0T41_00790 [Rhodobacteraceae bacterium]|nr:hypothetical protein [Paracoccaceae bacterium]
MRTAALVALAILTLAACAAPPGGAATPGCVRLLQNYDLAERNFGNSSSLRELALPSAIERTAQLARQAGCITRAGDLDRLDAQRDAFAATLQGERGAPIPRTWLQVGVVAGVASEVQARNFFGGLGFTVRSRGAPGLGRRIFIGLFTTEGGLAEATDLALRAGFVAPYVRRF